MRPDGLLIGQVASRSGVTGKALRLYERVGILPPPHRNEVVGLGVSLMEKVMPALRTRGDPTVLAQPAVTCKRVMREGVTVSMLGASVVAVWFLVVDAMAGVPFRTPALLGGVLFHGVTDPLHPAVTAEVILQYTLVHGVVFLVFGLMVAGLLALADREPRLLFALVILFCCFEVFVVGAIAILAERLFATAAWWTILAANALATLIMAGYLFLAHRRLVRDFLQADD